MYYFTAHMEFFPISQAAFDEFNLLLIDFAFVYAFGYEFYFCPEPSYVKPTNCYTFCMRIFFFAAAVEFAVDKSSQGGF